MFAYHSGAISCQVMEGRFYLKTIARIIVGIEEQRSSSVEVRAEPGGKYFRTLSR